MELEAERAAYEARGIRVAAVSYDTVEILKTFSDRAGLGFPLLADPDVEVIEAFGIVNQSVPKDHFAYGFPYAGYYLIDEEGRVKSKYFGEENNQRYTSANILVREFEAEADSRQGSAESDQLTATWSASNAQVRPGQVVALVLEVDLPDKIHVYAPGVDGGYIAVEWELQAPEGTQVFPASYPEAEVKHLPAIDEEVPVYEDKLRILRDLRILGGRSFPEVLRGKEELVVEGSFRYQACDDKICYPPSTLPLKWTFGLVDHDLERVPEPIRRSGDNQGAGR